jgi:hypothetical protein
MYQVKWSNTSGEMWAWGGLHDSKSEANAEASRWRAAGNLAIIEDTESCD